MGPQESDPKAFIHNYPNRCVLKSRGAEPCLPRVQGLALPGAKAGACSGTSASPPAHP